MVQYSEVERLLHKKTHIQYTITINTPIDVVRDIMEPKILIMKKAIT